MEPNQAFDDKTLEQLSFYIARHATANKFPPAALDSNTFEAANFFFRVFDNLVSDLKTQNSEREDLPSGASPNPFYD